MIGKGLAVALLLASAALSDGLMPQGLKPGCELDFCNNQFQSVFTRAGAIICQEQMGLLYATNDLSRYGGHSSPVRWERPTVHTEFPPGTPQYWGCAVYGDGVQVQIATAIGLRGHTVLTNLGWVWQIDLRN